MTPEQLASIRARLDAATPGPWRWVNRHYTWGDQDDYDPAGPDPTGHDDYLVGPGEPGHVARVHSDGSACGEYSPDIDTLGPDAALIAHAPADLAALLAYVEQLEGLLRDLCEDSRRAAEAVRVKRFAEHALAKLNRTRGLLTAEDRAVLIEQARLSLLLATNDAVLTPPGPP